jgi:hypothetical protein
MELVKCKSNATDKYLEIIPEKGWKDNSIYEITLKNIKDLNGNTITKTFTLYTKLSPIFSDINAVKSLIADIGVPDTTILYNIREASKYAEYIKGGKIDENDIPFEVTQFVKYRAAHECLLNFSVQESTTVGISGKVGDVTFADKETNRDISKLLKSFLDEVNKWMDGVKGYHNEGRAKMQTAVKGYYPSTYINQPVGVEFDRGVGR